MIPLKRILTILFIIMPIIVHAQFQFMQQTANVQNIGGPVKRAANGNLVQLVLNASAGSLFTGNLSILRTDSNGIILLNRRIMELRPYDFPVGLVLINDNGLLITITNSNPTSPNPLYTVKVDSLGTILWTKFHETERYVEITCYTEMSNGTVLFGGKIQEANTLNSDMLLMCIDTTGNQLWCKSYNYPGDEKVTSCIVNSDSEILITGSKNYGGVYLYSNYVAKISSAGNLINAWDFTNDSNPVVSRPGKIHLTTSGRMFITASFKMPPNTNPICTMILELDSNLQVKQYAAFSSISTQLHLINAQNSYIFETAVGEIKLFTSGYYPIIPGFGNTIFYISFDNNLNVQNTYKMGLLGTEIIIQDMLKVSDELFVQSCHIKDHLGTAPLISNYSRLQKINSDSPASCFYELQQNISDTLINFNIPSLISFNEISHSVSDSTGSVVFLNQNLQMWSCLPVGFEDFETMQQHELIFPNPTDGAITVSSNIKFEEGAFKLYDLTGRIILSRNVIENQKIDISQLPPSIYLYEFSLTNNKRYFGKIIKQ